MPTEIYVSVLVACISLVVLAVVWIAMAVHLKTRIKAMESDVSQLRGLRNDLSVLIQESRQAVQEARAITARASGSVDDLAQITHTARQWTERADRLVEAVGAIAEPPVFLLSRNVKTVGRVASAVVQALLHPRHNGHPEP